MFLKKMTVIKLILAVLFALVPVFAGAVNINQTVTLEKDGSGTIRLFYTEKDATIKEKNSLIGNLPFTKEKASENFKAVNTQITFFGIDKDPQDNSATRISIVLAFKKITDVLAMKAFSEIKANMAKTDSGNVFTFNFTTAFIKTNMVNSIYFTLTSNGDKIGSANGTIKDKSVTWARNQPYAQAVQDFALSATIGEATGKTASSESGAGNDKEKSCGLFGFELPLVLMGGLVLFARKRKK